MTESRVEYLAMTRLVDWEANTASALYNTLQHLYVCVYENYSCFG